MKPGDLSRIDSQAAAPAGSCLRPVLRAGAQTPERNENDAIAQEVPVALEYNGISHATLLAMTTDLEDFIYGISYTEGIIRLAREIYGVDITEIGRAHDCTTDTNAKHVSRYLLEIKKHTRP